MRQLMETFMIVSL